MPRNIVPRRTTLQLSRYIRLEGMSGDGNQTDPKQKAVCSVEENWDLDVFPCLLALAGVSFVLAASLLFSLVIRGK